MAVTVPVIIDTTEVNVAETTLALYPGRSIVNGNNLEIGVTRLIGVGGFGVRRR